MTKISTEILLKQVKVVNDSLKLTILSSFILGSTLTFILSQEFSSTNTFIWFLFFLASLLFRVYLFQLQKKTTLHQKNLTKWIRLNFLNAIASSFVYSIAGITTVAMNNNVHVTITYIILAGATAGSVTAYGPIKGLTLSFLLPIICPLILSNLIIGDINHYLLAMILALYIFIIGSIAHGHYNTFLSTFQQGIEIRNLKEEKLRMEDLAKLKSDFFASMSHEIRTPLNGIIGLVDLLQTSEVTSEQKADYYNTIKKSSDDLLNVINDVLDLSKIESGKLQLIPKETHINTFARRMITLFSEKAKTKGISLQYIENKKLPSVILVDEHRLSQVVTNLISNAIKFTNEGHVSFSIEIVEKEDKVATLTFRIKDTGIGIPINKQKIIFNKYDQIANNKNYLITEKGTGLGLSISKKIVEMMEGQIGVESKEEAGSNFWFTISTPIVRDQKLINKKTLQGDNGEFNLHILIVDDREINLKVAKLMFEKLGCTVELATNGSMAIEMFEAAASSFDLIVMDIQMPIMDGITATKKLNQMYPGKLPPIYGLSAQIPENLHKTPKELGFDYYLTKPLSLQTLSEGLKRVSDVV